MTRIFNIELSGEQGFEPLHFQKNGSQLCDFVRCLYIDYGTEPEPSSVEIMAAVGGDCLMISDKRQIQINEIEDNTITGITLGESKLLN